MLPGDDVVVAETRVRAARPLDLLRPALPRAVPPLSRARARASWPSRPRSPSARARTTGRSCCAPAPSRTSPTSSRPPRSGTTAPAAPRTATRMIVDPWGAVLAQVPDGEGIAVAELDFDRQDRAPPRAAGPRSHSPCRSVDSAAWTGVRLWRRLGAKEVHMRNVPVSRWPSSARWRRRALAADAAKGEWTGLHHRHALRRERRQQGPHGRLRREVHEGRLEGPALRSSPRRSPIALNDFDEGEGARRPEGDGQGHASTRPTGRSRSRAPPRPPPSPRLAGPREAAPPQGDMP